MFNQVPPNPDPNQPSIMNYVQCLAALDKAITAAQPTFSGTVSSNTCDLTNAIDEYLHAPSQPTTRPPPPVVHTLLQTMGSLPLSSITSAVASFLPMASLLAAAAAVVITLPRSTAFHMLPSPDLVVPIPNCPLLKRPRDKSLAMTTTMTTPSPQLQVETQPMSSVRQSVVSASSLSQAS
ncbi:hypothetical protein OG21DRAFT_942880 [Imleria badia]|nr:hypothetical protein OG21DRAFT_942880 [Imleria badia]